MIIRFLIIRQEVMNDILVEMQSVYKSYAKNEILKDINLQIKRGEIYGLIGPNGAGKTTIMKVMANLVKPDRGKLRYGWNSDCNKENRMNFIIESPYCFSELTAYENMYFQYLQKGLIEEKEIEERLKFVGLDKDEKKKISQYSLGMKQRLGIAMSLLGNGELIVLDEPTNGLDPDGIIELRDMIKKLNKESGITFVISSHNLSELSKISTRYVFIKEGSIKQEITAGDLKKFCEEKYILDTSDNDYTIKIIEQTHTVHSGKNKKGKIEIDCEIDIRKLSRQLYKNHIYIYELCKKEVSLEQYFLRLMGEESF